MSRFNLLVVSDDPTFGRKALKAVSKSYRKNFIFEVENQLEARKVLERIHMDMILVDLDYQNMKLGPLSSDFEDVQVIGITSYVLGDPKQPGRAIILPKAGFESLLMGIIRDQKKGHSTGRVSRLLQKRLPETPSFDNYATLLSA